MDFKSSLDRHLEEVERPPILPLGHYIWNITKHPSNDPLTGKDGTPYTKLTFHLGCISAHDDVDEDELSAYGNCNGAYGKLDFLFNEAEGEERKFEETLFRVKTFLEACGIDMKGKSTGEALAESVGASFLGEVKHRPDPNNPDRIYEEIGRFAAA